MDLKAGHSGHLQKNIFRSFLHLLNASNVREQLQYCLDVLQPVRNRSFSSMKFSSLAALILLLDNGFGPITPSSPQSFKKIAVAKPFCLPGSMSGACGFKSGMCFSGI